jgi:hypothetical protein
MLNREFLLRIRDLPELEQGRRQSVHGALNLGGSRSYRCPNFLEGRDGVAPSEVEKGVLRAKWACGSKNIAL